MGTATRSQIPLASNLFQADKATRGGSSPGSRASSVEASSRSRSASPSSTPPPPASAPPNPIAQYPYHHPLLPSYPMSYYPPPFVHGPGSFYPLSNQVPQPYASIYTSASSQAPVHAHSYPMPVYPPPLHTPFAHGHAISLDRSSSPLPPDAGSVEDMCTKYGLGDEILDRLEKLRFQIGDDLSVLTEEKWTAAGFTDLEWDRVKTAYRRYKRTLKDSI